MVWTFLLSSILSPLSPSLWETARYRLKYCLKGPLNPKQPTNQGIGVGGGVSKMLNFFMCQASYPVPVTGLVLFHSTHLWRDFMLSRWASMCPSGVHTPICPSSLHFCSNSNFACAFVPRMFPLGLLMGKVQ